MRGEKILTVLEQIGSAAIETIKIIDFIITPVSTKGHYFKLGGKPYRKENDFPRLPENQETRLRKQAYVFLYRLKKNGLIKKRIREGESFWFVTGKGKNKIDSLRSIVGLPSGQYKKEPAKTLVIVSFDVPEDEKRKRNWLRAVLKRLGFMMMQKSVWIGKVKIPEEFVDDLKKLNLIGCVEILAVTKAGTFRQLV